MNNWFFVFIKNKVNKVSPYVLRFSRPFHQILLCVVSIYSAKQAISDDVIIAIQK